VKISLLTGRADTITTLTYLNLTSATNVVFMFNRRMWRCIVFVILLSMNFTQAKCGSVTITTRGAVANEPISLSYLLEIQGSPLDR
jgi:hypothetical protein